MFLALIGIQAALSVPQKVTTGTYITELSDVSINNPAFECEFWIWFRWPTGSIPGYDPLSSFDTTTTHGDRVISYPLVEEVPERNETLVTAKVRATFSMQQTGIWNYPFDTHDLIISYEDAGLSLKLKWIMR